LIFDLILSERIFAIIISEIWPIIYGIFIAIILLKRRINRSTISLSIYFLGFASVFLIGFASLFLVGTPYSMILYSISLYLLIFIQIMPILSSWIMISLPQKIKSSKIILLLIFYGLLATYVFWIGFPLHGINYGQITGWIPEYSSLFFWFTFCYITIALMIPEVILAKKLLKTFSGFEIGNRVKLFIIGVFLLYIDMYFVLVYNTWITNLTYRSIHLIISIPLTTIGAFLIYLGFGRSLGPKRVTSN
jgi:hypothetical protein